MLMSYFKQYKVLFFYNKHTQAPWSDNSYVLDEEWNRRFGIQGVSVPQLGGTQPQDKLWDKEPSKWQELDNPLFAILLLQTVRRRLPLSDLICPL